MIKDRVKKTTSNRFHRLVPVIQDYRPLRAAPAGDRSGKLEGGGRDASPVGGEICLFGLPAFCRFLFCFVF